jgi:hypothetical protein
MVGDRGDFWLCGRHLMYSTSQGWVINEGFVLGDNILLALKKKSLNSL